MVNILPAKIVASGRAVEVSIDKQSELYYAFPVKVSESESHLVLSDSLRPHGLYSPWNSLGQNTGVGSLSLLQGIFPTQGLNSGLPPCRRILYQLSHKEANYRRGPA